MWFKAKLIAIGSAILTGLAFFLRFQMVKNQRDRYKIKTEVVEAQLQAVKIRKRIIKEGKEDYVSRRVELLREIEKEEEDFKGLPNLSNPNKYQ